MHAYGERIILDFATPNIASELAEILLLQCPLVNSKTVVDYSRDLEFHVNIEISIAKCATPTVGGPCENC